MRDVLAVCLLGVLLATFAGCGSAATISAGLQKEEEIPSAEKLPIEAGNEKQTMKQQNIMEIQVNGKNFRAVLEDNAAAQAFWRELPLSVSMEELNGNEKFYKFSKQFPSDDQSIGSIHSGDLMLYNGSYIVLFYQDFSTSYRYTRLGHIENPDVLAEAVGKGDVEVSFHK